MSVEKVILFHVNDQVFGINVEYVNAIESAVSVVNVPNAPENIEGIINLRGTIIPVYSLRNKFHLSENETSNNAQLIITKSEEQIFAFKVDCVNEIYELPHGTYMNPPDVLKSEDTSYIDGIVNVKGQLVICLDVHSIMSEHEKQRMQEFAKSMSEQESE